MTASKLIRLALASSALALSNLSAHAQVFQYNNGDLILDFSEANYSDVEVDIGSEAGLISGAQANGGTNVLSGTYYNVSSQLTNNFGGTLSGVSFSVVGTQLGSGAPTDWLTQAQPGVNSITPPTNLNPTKQNQVSGVVDNIEGVGHGTGILPWSTDNPADSVANTATVVIIPTGGGVEANDSYTKTVGNTFTGAPANPKNTAPAGFSSGSIVSDLFEFDPTNGTGSSIYEGSFTLNSDGTLDFSLPTPPSTTITAITNGSGTISVTFNTKVGVQYSLFYTTQLTVNRSAWTSVPGSVTGTGAPATLTDNSPTDVTRFYTVASSFP